MQTGRNVANIYFVEIKRLSAILCKAQDENKTISHEIFKPMPIESSISSRYKTELVDIDGNLLDFDKQFYTMSGKNYNMNQLYGEDGSGRFDLSNLPDYIFQIALNNTIYYASLSENSSLDSVGYFEERSSKFHR